MDSNSSTDYISIYSIVCEQDKQHNEVLLEKAKAAKKTKAAPHCRKCKKPMKGHPRGQCE